MSEEKHSSHNGVIASTRCVDYQNEKYKVYETDRKFDNFLRNVSSISIGTFFHICSMYGINWKEGRS